MGAFHWTKNSEIFNLGANVTEISWERSDELLNFSKPDHQTKNYRTIGTKIFRKLSPSIFNIFYSMLVAKMTACSKMDKYFTPGNSHRNSFHSWEVAMLKQHLEGPVIRATFFFNLSRNIVVLQDETLCCAYYQVCGLISQQIQACRILHL